MNEHAIYEAVGAKRQRYASRTYLLLFFSVIDVIT